MIIKKLPLNDEHAQCFEKMQEESVEVFQQRKAEMRNCHHLFVILKKEENENSVDEEISNRAMPHKIECLYCGLTNKFMPYEDQVRKEYVLHKINLHNKHQQTIETEMFIEQFSDVSSKDGMLFFNFPLDFISSEELPTYHADLLFKLAIKISPHSSSQEIFAIMKTLHSLETPHERLRLQRIEEANELLERYYEYQSGKSLILVKTMKSH